MTNKIEPTFNEYQSFTKETAIYPRDNQEKVLSYLILGLVGEAGEIANTYKKAIRDEKGELSIEKNVAILKELGDVLWYIARITDELNVDLSVIALENINKLSSRKDRGTIGGSGDNR